MRIKILITLVTLLMTTSVLASSKEPFDPRRYGLIQDSLDKVCRQAFKGDAFLLEACYNGTHVCMEDFREAIESNSNFDKQTLILKLSSCTITVVKSLGGRYE